MIISLHLSTSQASRNKAQEDYGGQNYESTTEQANTRRTTQNQSGANRDRDPNQAAWSGI